MQFATFSTLKGGSDFNGLYDYYQNRTRAEFVLPVSELAMDNTTGEIVIGNSSYLQTEFASSIICKELAMPATYIANAPNELAAQNFNFHAPTATGSIKVIIESLGGIDSIVGYTPEKINPVPIDLIVEELDKAAHGMEMKEWRIDDSGLLVRLVSPKYTSEPKVGDLVYAGVDFLDYENSGGLDVRGAMYRLSCTNGAVVSDTSFARNIKKVGWQSSAAIVTAALGYFEAGCQAAMSHVMTLKSLTEMPLALPDVYEDSLKVIRKPLAIVGVKPRFDIAMIDAMVTEEKTYFGLYNAITRLGRDANSREDKFILERGGYKMVLLANEAKEAYDQAYQDLMN